VQRSEVDFPSLKEELASLYLPDAAALLVVSVATIVENYSVARFQRRVAIDDYEVDAHLANAPDKRPSLFAESGGNESLMIDAVHPAGEQAARERHLELIFLRGR
jgi:hypothetical protein